MSMRGADFARLLIRATKRHDVDTSPTPTNAYCQFQVSGTGDPRDIRADLNATLFHANADGTNTFLSRALEAH
jgi:hypothetical protein